MPDDSIDLIMAQYNCTLDDRGRMQTDNLPPRINSAVTEYLAYKAFLDAQEGFSDWFKMFHSRPSRGKVENLDDLTDFTKQVSLRENARALNEKYESWKATIDHVTKVSLCFYKVGMDMFPYCLFLHLLSLTNPYDAIVFDLTV